MSLGLAMNGGAIRCSYYTGFLQYIYENKIVVDEISALSSGVVAALIYFTGENPREMFDHFTNELSKNRLKPKIFSQLLKQFIETYYAKNEDISKLNSKLKIVTTKIPHFKPTIFDKFENSAELNRISESSCSLPFFFDFPVKFKSEYYIDGYFSERNLESYLTTKKKIFLSSFAKKKPKSEENLFTSAIGHTLSIKDVFSTFLYDKEISENWFDKGYKDAIRLLA